MKRSSKLKGPQSPGFASADIALLPYVCIGGHRFLSTIKMYVEKGNSRYSFRTLAARSEVVQHIIQFLTENPECHTLRTDNAKEYLSNACVNVLNEHGIRKEQIAPGYSFSNGLSERAHSEFYFKRNNN